MYYLGAALYADGKQTPARELWLFLAGQDAAKEWGARSRRQSQSPFIEKPVTMP
jgi:hypothetical protein